MPIELRIHDANELLESQQLLLHAALIPVEVLFLLCVRHVQKTVEDEDV